VGSRADERALVRAIGSGSPEALAALFDRHGATVLALARRILEDRFEAEEVIEDVFWSLWSEPDLYDPSRGVPLAWLLVRTRSRALDRLRHRRRRRARLVEVGGLSELETLAPGDGSSSALLGAMDSERRTRLRAALSRLADEQRSAVELSFIEGLTHMEIAERLGIPLGTVKTRIRRGLLALRRLLEANVRREEVA
jgi:RNA polymerase sigma-70 factor (ECF subfamily)